MLELIIAAGSIAYAANMANQAEELSKKAQLKRERAVEYENNAYRKMKKAEEQAELSSQKLFNIKKGIYITSIARMREIFEPISTLSFLKSCYSFEKKEKIQLPAALSQMEYMENVYSQPMTKKQEIVAVCFGIAGIMHAEKKMQEQEMAYASQQMRLARLVETQYSNQCMAFNTIKNKNEVVWELLRDLNILFVKALNASAESIDKHGKEAGLYSDTEVDQLRFTLQLADMICKICDSSLVTNDGEFYSDIAELIEKGHEILNETNSAIRTRRN